jgi:hypothetical protein
MQACAQRSGIALPTVLTVAEAVQALAPHGLKGVKA